MDDTFRVRLDAARRWEQALAAWVAKRGWHILPTYDFCGKGDDKAPKLVAPPGQPGLVLPDLQCFKGGRVKWCECKWKARADYYRKGGYRVTGISSRLLREYEAVEKATNAQVVLTFLHEAEQEIRGAPIKALRSSFSHAYSGPMMSHGGMVFWKYDAIPRWCALSALTETPCP